MLISHSLCTSELQQLPVFLAQSPPAHLNSTCEQVVWPDAPMLIQVCRYVTSAVRQTGSCPVSDQLSVSDVSVRGR